MRKSKGFTLIELLIVMAIMSVLAMLALGGYSAVQNKAKVSTATANIASFKTALAMYNQLMGVYPGAGGTAPKDDPEALFKALYTGNPKLGGSRDNHLEDWQPRDIGRWQGPVADPEAIWERATEDDLDFTSTYKRALCFLDPWGRPYHYVHWDSFPQSERRLQGSPLKGVGSQPYAIWSDGPNRRNDWGKEDDVTSWGGGS